MPSIFRFNTLPAAYDDLAPDTSEIRLLTGMACGGLCHCTLPIGSVSKPVRHKTVSEIWFCLSGTGEIWQGRGESSEVRSFAANDAFTIPLANSFQFRNTGDTPLQILITTMPAWPGPDEAEMVNGYW